jgi:hypothetical protein
MLCGFLDQARDLKFNLNEEALDRFESYLRLPLEAVPSVWEAYVAFLERDPDPQAYLSRVIELLQEAAESLGGQTDDEFLQIWNDCSDRYKLLLGQVKRFQPVGKGYWEELP